MARRDQKCIELLNLQIQSFPRKFEAGNGPNNQGYRAAARANHRRADLDNPNYESADYIGWPWL